MSEHWIVTHTGKRFDLLEPTLDTIDIYDIAHALARIPHWNGHTTGTYTLSVAQHSIMVAWALNDFAASLIGILHDAEEAYIGDMTRPMKALLRKRTDLFDIVGQGIRDAIYFKYLKHQPKTNDFRATLVSRADNAVLKWESHQYVDREALERYGWPEEKQQNVFSQYVDWAAYGRDELIEPWGADKAEARYLDAFYMLEKQQYTAPRR